MLRPVHARGRLGGAVHRDHRPRPHDVRRDQAHGALGLRGQPGDRARRHLHQQRRDDRRRPQRRRADDGPDLLGGGASSGGRPGSRTRSTSAPRPQGAGRADQPLRGRDRPPGEEDRKRGRAVARPRRGGPEGHAHADVLDPRRAHAAGRLPHDSRRGRAGDPRGGHRHLQALRPRGDRGRPAFVQVTPARDDGSGPLPRPGIHRAPVRQGGAAAQLRARGQDVPRRGGAADHARRGARIGLRRDFLLGLPLGQRHALVHAGRDLGPAHSDADLQRQGQRRRLLGLRPLFPPGTLSNHSNPNASTGNAVLPHPLVHGLHQVDLAQPPGARVRGGGPGALRADRERVPGWGSPSTGRPARRRTSACRAWAAGRRCCSTGSTTAPPCGTPRATWGTWRCGS